MQTDCSYFNIQKALFAPAETSSKKLSYSCYKPEMNESD